MWTPSALKSEAFPASGDIWRIVEHQYTVSTLKLVDNHAEQQILEDILEESKPPYPAAAESLHYLLKTPFRYYPPRSHGSRFRAANESTGVYYGSVEIRTALAEMAYYRLRFFSAAASSILPVQPHKLSGFVASYQCQHSIDLTSKAFEKDIAVWTHPEDYTATQAFATIARSANICAIHYQSVRDPQQGKNIALLTHSVFTSPDIKNEQVWYMVIKEKEVYATRAGATYKSESFVFHDLL